LTTIQRIDPVYVDIPQSSADLLKLRRQISDGQLTKDGKAKVKLILEDGSTYALEGDLLFTDVTVDQATDRKCCARCSPIRAVCCCRACS
jgi:membrane fusion protein (multidrug efflux system)